MSTNELRPLPDPHTLEEAEHLVTEARQLLAQAQDIHDQALGAAIRYALRGGRRLVDVPELLGLTHAQVLRYLGRDDVSLLPHDPDAAVDLFLRYLPEIDRDDISWTRGARLCLQPTPAVERVAALAVRDGREFPYTVRMIGEGLVNRGVVQGAGNRSSVTRTYNGVRHKVWIMEAGVLENSDLAWSPDLRDPLARSLRATDHPDESGPTLRSEDARVAALRFLDLLGLVESSEGAGGLARFGAVKDDRLHIADPRAAVVAIAHIARTQDERFPWTEDLVQDGLRSMSALSVDGAGRVKVGRRVQGVLQRVWDLDRAFIPKQGTRRI